MHKTLLATVLAALVAAGCGDAAIPGNAQEVSAVQAGAVEPGPTCQVVQGSSAITDEIRETSGLTRGRARTDVLWTHNDGNRADLYALGIDGGVVARVRIEGIEIDDWEDLGAGPCDGGNCLFLADTGDNSGERENVTIFRIEEPAAGASSVAGAAALQARFPDGRWDTEAIFVTSDGVIHLVTKGREGPVALYRLPPTAAPGEVATLERLRELFPASPANEDRITGAAISPDGRWVGIRSNTSIYFYPAAALLSTSDPVEPTVIDLRPLGEPQGESLTIDPDGTVWLTSEAENKDARPMLSRIRCTFPA